MGVLSQFDTQRYTMANPLVRTLPNRSHGEAEVRLTIDFFKPLKRIYVAQPRSSKARKNKKRHQAWTLTKEFRQQVKPRLYWNSILDRNLDASKIVIFEEADRLTNGIFGKHFGIKPD